MKPATTKTTPGTWPLAARRRARPSESSRTWTSCPEGSDWTVPPYEGVIRDGFLYGRGANDNKCSCVSCLFALRAIREAGIPLRDRVLLILGCNEEKGSADMAHYMQHVGMPDYGFSPDSGFPVCYAEKGIHRMEIRGAFGGATPLISLAAGQAVNIVPNRCRACVAGRAGAGASPAGKGAPAGGPLQNRLRGRQNRHRGRGRGRARRLPRGGATPSP